MLRIALVLWWIILRLTKVTILWGPLIRVSLINVPRWWVILRLTRVWGIPLIWGSILWGPLIRVSVIKVSRWWIILRLPRVLRLRVALIHEIRIRGSLFGIVYLILGMIPVIRVCIILWGGVKFIWKCRGG